MFCSSPLASHLIGGEQLRAHRSSITSFPLRGIQVDLGRQHRRSEEEAGIIRLPLLNTAVNDVVLVSRFKLSIISVCSLITLVLGECGFIHLHTTSALRFDLLEVLVSFVINRSSSC